MNSRDIYTRLLLFVLSMTFLEVQYLAAQDMRTWTDKSGKFTIDASFVDYDGTQVTIKNSAGKNLTLDLDKLSSEDQEYVKSQSEENPFAVAERAGSPENSGSATPTRGNRPKTLEIDIDEAVEIGDYGDTNWSCKPDPSPLPKYAARPRKLNFRIGDIPFAIHPEETPFYFSPNDGKIAHTVTVLGSHNNRDGWKNVSRLYFGDVSTGKTNSLDRPEKLYPYGFSADGKKLMFHEGSWEFGSDWGKKRKLHIFSYENGNISLLHSFEPFAGIPTQNTGFNREKDIEWAAWVDGKHILVLSGGERLVLIDIDGGKAVWQMKTANSPNIVLSPGKKYCIVPAPNKAVLLIETLNGETVGNIEIAGNTLGKLNFAFSPDGKKIALPTLESLSVWEADTGKSLEPFFLRNVTSMSDLVWTSNDTILIGNTLIDPVNRVPLWEYQRTGMKNMLELGGYVWYMSSKHNEGQILNAVVIPHPSVKMADGAVPDSDIYSIYPGLDVSIQIDNSITKNKDEILKTVTKKLTDNGLNVKNRAAITVVLKLSKEAEKKATYVVGSRFTPMFSRQAGGTEVTYRPEKYTIQIQKDGKNLWEDSKTTSPPNFELNDVNKTSLQAAVDKEMENFNYKDWIEKVRIPKKVNDPSKIGVSRLTDMGIQDVERR